MGEIAEMMLDGTMCACCGEWLDTDAGYPIYCASCAPDFIDNDDDLRVPDKTVRHEKVQCPDCGKRVKKKGLADHRRDVHDITPCWHFSTI